MGRGQRTATQAAGATQISNEQIRSRLGARPSPARGWTPADPQWVPIAPRAPSKEARKALREARSELKVRLLDARRAWDEDPLGRDRHLRARIVDSVVGALCDVEQAKLGEVLGIPCPPGLGADGIFREPYRVASVASARAWETDQAATTSYSLALDLNDLVRAVRRTAPSVMRRTLASELARRAPHYIYSVLGSATERVRCTLRDQGVDDWPDLGRAGWQQWLDECVKRSGPDPRVALAARLTGQADSGPAR